MKKFWKFVTIIAPSYVGLLESFMEHPLHHFGQLQHIIQCSWKAIAAATGEQ
jgi:hypothetical protein